MESARGMSRSQQLEFSFPIGQINKMMNHIDMTEKRENEYDAERYDWNNSIDDYEKLIKRMV